MGSHAGHNTAIRKSFWYYSFYSWSLSTKHYTNKFGFNLISSQERFERTKREFENKLQLNNKNDIIFLSGRLDWYFIEPIISKSDIPIEHYSDSLNKIDARKSLDIWLSKLDNLASEMYLKNINIVVMAPIPVFTGVKHVPHAVMCYKEWFRPTLPNDCKTFTENKEFLKERIVH